MSEEKWKEMVQVGSDDNTPLLQEEIEAMEWADFTIASLRAEVERMKSEAETTTAERDTLAALLIARDKELALADRLAAAAQEDLDGVKMSCRAQSLRAALSAYRAGKPPQEERE